MRQQILDYFARNQYVLVGRYWRADVLNFWFAPLGPAKDDSGLLARLNVIPVDDRRMIHLRDLLGNVLRFRSAGGISLATSILSNRRMLSCPSSIGAYTHAPSARPLLTPA